MAICRCCRYREQQERKSSTCQPSALFDEEEATTLHRRCRHRRCRLRRRRARVRKRCSKKIWNREKIVTETNVAKFIGLWTKKKQKKYPNLLFKLFSPKISTPIEKLKLTKTKISRLDSLSYLDGKFLWLMRPTCDKTTQVLRRNASKNSQKRRICRKAFKQFWKQGWVESEQQDLIEQKQTLQQQLKRRLFASKESKRDLWKYF